MPIKNRRTVAQKIADCYTVFKHLKEGTSVKHKGSKDGSAKTKPIFDGMPDVPESKVLEDCQSWLKKRNILAWRNNTGTGSLGFSGQIYRFGIKDGGDIVGLLPNGKHFEIECKAGKGGRWTVGQQIRSVEIAENKGLYFLVHGLQELEYFFRDLI